MHKALGSIRNTARQNRKLKFFKFNRCLLSVIKEIVLDPRLLQQRGEAELNSTKTEIKGQERLINAEVNKWKVMEDVGERFTWLGTKDTL